MIGIQPNPFEVPVSRSTATSLSFRFCYMYQCFDIKPTSRFWKTPKSIPSQSSRYSNLNGNTETLLFISSHPKSKPKHTPRVNLFSVDMCYYERIIWHCRHATLRRTSYCQQAQADPSHRCPGQKIVTHEWVHPWMNCENCGDNVKYRNDGIQPGDRGSWR